MNTINTNENGVIMEGVQEYCEGGVVRIFRTTGTYKYNTEQEKQTGYGRLVILAENEGGNNCTEVDLLQLIKWLKENMPELIV